MPAESPAKKSTDCISDTTQLFRFERRLTDQRHGGIWKATDALTPSPTSRVTPYPTPDAAPTAKPNQIRPQFTDEIVTLQNGSEADAETACVRKELLDYLTPLWGGRTVQCIILPKTHATVFDMFINFLNAQEDTIPYLPSQPSPEPWRSYVVDAWLFGHLVKSLSFERFALSHFLNTCALLDSAVFLRIEEDGFPKSSLSRFSKHWVAWNHSFASDGQSEYTHLAAAKLASVVTRETNDPRIYDVDHWYSSCGNDINSSCIHDPIVRENAARNLVASRRPVSEKGLLWERDNQPGYSKKAPALAFTSNKRSSPPTGSTLLPPPPYSQSGHSKLFQASAAAQSRLSAASSLPPPPNPILPPRPPPKFQPKPMASNFSKSSNAASRKSMFTTTAETESAVPVPTTPVIDRVRNDIPMLPLPPRQRNFGSRLAHNQTRVPPVRRSDEPDKYLMRPQDSIPALPSRPRTSSFASSRPQRPEIGSRPLKQLSPMARLLRDSDMAPRPRTPVRLDASLRRAKSGALIPNQK